MKKLLILLAAIAPFITSCAHAQEISQQNVPSVINNAFTSNYANASDIEWEKHGDIYDVEFEQNKIDHHIWYSADGKTIKHKTEVRVSTIPAPISETLKKDFSSFKVDDVDLIEENGNTFYVIELDSTTVDRIIHVTADGKVIANYVKY